MSKKRLNPPVPAEPAQPETAKPTFDQKNLLRRLGTSLVFAALFLTLIYYGPAWGYFLLMAFAMAWGAREFGFFGEKMGFYPNWKSSTISAWLILTHFFLAKTSYGEHFPLWAAILVGLFLSQAWALFYDRNLEKALPSQAITSLAGLYLGLGLGFQMALLLLKSDLGPSTGARLITALYLITWFGDSAAYFIGKPFGRHKLAKRVSPGKSWEGLAGNLAGNIAGAFLMKYAQVTPGWTPIDCVAIGLLLGSVGLLGDLIESTWKRSAGVKDSNAGHLEIPGHGGMLDRIDSLVYSAPALYAYVHFVHGLN